MIIYRERENIIEERERYIYTHTLRIYSNPIPFFWLRKSYASEN